MQIVPPPVADFAEARRRRDERLASAPRCQPVTPVDPRQFCVAAIRRELAEVDEGTAALNAAIDAAAGRPRVPRDFDGPAAA